MGDDEMTIPLRILFGSRGPMNEQQKKDADSFDKNLSGKLKSAFAKTKRESIESGLLSEDDWHKVEIMPNEATEKTK
jgi:hypothetical protein